MTKKKFEEAFGVCRLIRLDISRSGSPVLSVSPTMQLTSSAFASPLPEAFSALSQPADHSAFISQLYLLPSSYSPNSQASSEAESATVTEAGGKVKRGRPQQDIKDSDDASSQRRRHRRLYARQYRAQMRQKVDEVGLLREQLHDMRRRCEESTARAEDAERRLQLLLAQRSQSDAVFTNLISVLLSQQPSFQLSTVSSALSSLSPSVIAQPFLPDVNPISCFTTTA